MRSEFQDVFKDAYDHWIDDACSQRYHASKSLALQVWNHQQSKVDELQAKLEQAYEDIETFATAHQRECEFKAQFAKEKNELQKRVDQQGLIIAKVMSIASDLQKSWAMFEIGKKLEQALKGGIQ